MKNKIWLVARREYIRIVTRPSFWASVVLLPIFMVVVSVISGYSSQSLEKKLASTAEQAQKIYVVDHSGIVRPDVLQGSLQAATDFETAQAEVRAGRADAVIVYPADLAARPAIRITQKDDGLIGQGRYGELAQQLVKNSVLVEIADPQRQALLNARFDVQTENYKDGKKTDYRMERFIVPIASIAMYFLMVMMIAGFMLMSIAEEKENRMIETILSIISGRQLIWGKIIGLTLVGFTQLLALSAMALAALPVIQSFAHFSIDWSAISLNPFQVAAALFFIVTGFLFMASIMVGVGSALPSYKEAQSFSSVFIILSIFPVYFASALIAEPAGTIARVTSFTPFTAPLVLLFRNAMDAISVVELIAGMALMAVYVVVGFYVAFALFTLGSLEYGRRVSPLGIFRRQKN